ncbi:ester cyclase [Haloferax prahovense]|uniref:ester cyclase n=1 Tax=Haloferax TaxID=2251 RepID=UPI000737B7A4|nr:MULTISPECIES: ester cyclase [unclassified Haloferax]MCO8268171.1 ester cyclase [Haloferax sp. AB510]
MGTESVAPERANVELCRRYVEEFVNEGDATAAEELVHEDVVTHQLGVDADRVGRDALVDQILGFRGAVPDWHLAVEDVVGEGDRVMMRLTARGTPQEPWGNLVPTGKSFEQPAFFVFHLEDGRIVEQWNLVNLMGIARQLGLLPPGPRVIAKVAAHRIRSRLGGGRRRRA